MAQCDNWDCQQNFDIVWNDEGDAISVKKREDALGREDDLADRPWDYK